MPCTTTGTTWALCGHSIYQHAPTCRHSGSKCAKRSTPVPGICPSCTQLEYHPSPVTAPLPSQTNSNSTPIKTESVSEDGVNSTPTRPRIKAELQDKKQGDGELSQFGIYSRLETPELHVILHERGLSHAGIKDDLILRLLEDDSKGEETRSGVVQGQAKVNPYAYLPTTTLKMILQGRGLVTGGEREELLSRLVEDDQKKKEGRRAGDVNGGGLGGGAGGQPRIPIGSNMNEFVRDPDHFKPVDEEVSKTFGAQTGSNIGFIAGIGGQGVGQTDKEYFFNLNIKQLEQKLEEARLREAEKNVEITNLKSQVRIMQESERSVRESTQESTPLSGELTRSNFADSSLRPWDREQLSRGQGSGSGGVHGARERMDGGQCHAARSQIDAQGDGSGDNINSSRTQAAQSYPNSSQTQTTQSQVNGNQPQARQEKSARPVRPPTPSQFRQLEQERISHIATTAAWTHSQPTSSQSQSAEKEKFSHIAAISFTALIISLIAKLKTAVTPSPIENYFDLQIKYTLQCAGEGDFSKIVKGYREFVDFVGVQIKESEKWEIEGVKVALRECEEFVQVVIDVRDLF